MYLAIPRDGNLFAEDVADQINVRINELDNVTKELMSGKSTREHYYDKVRKVDISIPKDGSVNASFSYGKVMVIDLSFLYNEKYASDRDFATISNYKNSSEVWLKATDSGGNATPVRIDKFGNMRFVNPLSGVGNIAIFGLIIL